MHSTAHASRPLNSSLHLIDTHCHLDMTEFDADRAQVIERARAAGIEAIISVGSDLEGTVRAMKLSGEYDFVFASVGIHPHDAKDFSEDVFLQLREWAGSKKVVAIGETGLDYHYDHSPREVQKEVFEKHLLLAGETGLPVIIHSREAQKDTLEILKKSGITRGVLHCFSGDMEMAEQVMAMGFYISVAGPVTFRKAKELKEIAAKIPDDYLLVETDAPYLSPEPFRGKRNEPAYILHTLEHIAGLRGVSLEDIARITTLNAKRLFGIGTISGQAEIAYKIRDSLYLNITNRCTNKCSFCVKFRSDFVKGHRLRLAHEPTEEEIRHAIGDPKRFREIVFCGYGEPLQRLDTVVNISRWVKDHGGRVRINTNGHAHLIHKRDVLPDLRGIVDSISISLDAHDEETYNRICKPVFKKAFQEILRFTREAKEFIPQVQVTVVALKGVDMDKCRAIAEDLGVPLKIRKLDVVG
ncbi:MAG: YchF/TatD family DNA exonuclease [Nitrospirota bacterium]|nr:YchF/TatD family DNA exonuclease [Nitrospirota bacterium]